MRLNTHPENLIERIALRAGVVPTPLGDTIVAMTLVGHACSPKPGASIE